VGEADLAPVKPTERPGATEELHRGPKGREEGASTPPLGRTDPTLREPNQRDIEGADQAEGQPAPEAEVFRRLNRATQYRTMLNIKNRRARRIGRSRRGGDPSRR
jgi:hypothetical protein